MGAIGCDGGPKAECAIDVDPCAGFVCFSTDFANGIECAGVYVSGLTTNDRWTGEFWKCIGANAALIVDGHALVALMAEAQGAQAAEEGRMRFLAYDDGYRRGSK